jgi:hypothetical protein
MTGEELLHQAFVSHETDPACSEAVLLLRDGSRLYFRHRVGERWAKAVGPNGRESEGGLAADVLARMTLFRLNAKHLDIAFSDTSRWEMRFGKAARRRASP